VNVDELKVRNPPHFMNGAFLRARFCNRTAHIFVKSSACRQGQVHVDRAGRQAGRQMKGGREAGREGERERERETSFLFKSVFRL
jgi:hypothetical protein